jgi:GH25 family lysozyme M1 (1,4-beta-N-acetylmuramidase)
VTANRGTAAWKGAAMAGLLFGWDASNHDWDPDRGRMDLAAAARDGIVFFTHKATEGTSFPDSHYGEALTRAKAAGIPFLGAYHVVRTPGNAQHLTKPAGSISAQVDYFLDHVDASTPWWREFRGWFWQCDLESWSDKHGTYDNVAAELGIQWSDLVRERTGRTVLLYASKGMYGDRLRHSRHPLWNANYPTFDEQLMACPAAHFRRSYTDSGGDAGPGWHGYSGRQPVFWQFSDNATIGSQHRTDANAFQGNLSQLWTLINPKARPAQMGDDMPNGDIPTGFSFDEAGQWLTQTRAVAVPLPVVGQGAGQWGNAWLYLAGTGDATIRFGAHAGGNWTWSDTHLTTAAGPAGPLALQPGTDKLIIGRKRRAADDTADAAPTRWHVQYAPKE